MKTGTRRFTGHFISQPYFADELFRDLAPCSEETLALIRRTRRFERNNTVVAAGDLPKCLYILKGGQARMTVHNGINDTTTLRLVKTDEVLGLNELIGNSFCQMNVETITPCEFECFSRADFIEFLDREPKICCRLLNALGADLTASYRDFTVTEF
jgi:CRP-like cAMP-binding protein